MASKSYGYYNKGNKIGLAEKVPSSGGGTLSVAHCSISGNDNKVDCEAAGGQWIPASGSGNTTSTKRYESPSTTVANGLEIEYSYAPTFNPDATGEAGGDSEQFIGWGSDGTNLCIFATHAVLPRALNGFSWLLANNYIYIRGSGRWSGLHQIKTGGNSDGVLVLKTKCHIASVSVIQPVVNIVSNETISGANAPNDLMMEELKQNLTSKYIYIEGAVDSQNNGLFEVNKDTTFGQFTALKEPTYTPTKGIYEVSAASFADETSDTVNVYNANYDQMTVSSVSNPMINESFELDLTRQQSKAVIFYLQAKKAEDATDIEAYEYYMKKFREYIRRSHSARKHGQYRLQGFWGMRR